jgi:hypothetical protein
MAAYIHPDVFDNGEVTLTNATSKVLHICSSQPANFAGVAAVSLGTKSGPTVSSPGARTPTGRKVTISAITDGAVSSTGTASHFALVDGTRLLVAGPLSSSQAVTSGNPFTLGAIDVGIPDPA